MDETTTYVVPETDIAALKEALYDQQQLLQQLYNELDAEREASATAASEALSMILRLQGEKASLKMEASQYKRMAEEKMYHEEEALAVFEDLIYQRELEIASLEFQVQAYRYRLLSMGCNDLGVYENKFPENLLMQRTDSLFVEKGVNSNVRRLNSLPLIPIKDLNHKKSTIERKRSTIPAPDSIPTIMEETASQEVYDSEKKSGSSLSGDINSYWKKIKKLDERVKEISDSKDSGRNRPTILKCGTWSPSLLSQVGISTPVDSKRAVNTASSDQAKHHENPPEKLASVNSACLLSVQDIFEVPKTTDTCKASDPWKEGIHKLSLEGESRLGKPDLLTDNVLKTPSKDETDWVKTMMLSALHEKKSPNPRDGISMDSNASQTHPPIVVGVSQAEYQQLSWRIGQLERTRNNVTQEITAGGREELNLLKDIHEQLKSIQSEMRTWGTKKSVVPDEPPLDPLQEAMLYFWL